MEPDEEVIHPAIEILNSAYDWNEESMQRAMQRGKELVKELEELSEQMAEVNARLIAINKARIILRKYYEKKGK